MQSSRKGWTLPFTPQFTVNQWLRFFAATWTAYLLFNTDNPLARLLFLTKEAYLHTSPWLAAMKVIGGGILYAGLIFGGLWWAGGRSALRQLLPQLRWRDLGIFCWYAALYPLFGILGRIATVLTANGPSADLNASLVGWQQHSWSAYQLMSVQSLFTTTANVVVVLMLFLAVNQVLDARMPGHPHWRSLCVYLLTGVLAGALTTTPLAPGLGINVLTVTLAQLPLLWSYRRSRNLVVPALIAWGGHRVLIGLILILNIL